MRILLGLILGIIVGFAGQSVVDLLASQIYPTGITEFLAREQYSEAIADRPTGALLLGVLGFFVGGLAGGFTAKLISRRGWTVWVPAGVLAMTVVVIAFSFPLQTWAAFGMLLAALVGGLIARHVGPDGEEEPAPAQATGDAGA